MINEHAMRLGEIAYHNAKPKERKSYPTLNDRLRAFAEAYLKEIGYGEEAA